MPSSHSGPVEGLWSPCSTLYDLRRKEPSRQYKFADSPTATMWTFSTFGWMASIDLMLVNHRCFFLDLPSDPEPASPSSNEESFTPMRVHPFRSTSRSTWPGPKGILQTGHRQPPSFGSMDRRASSPPASSDQNGVPACFSIGPYPAATR